MIRAAFLSGAAGGFRNSVKNLEDLMKKLRIHWSNNKLNFILIFDLLNELHPNRPQSTEPMPKVFTF